jgi:hypothetical protein
MTMKKLNALVDAIKSALKHRRSAERSRRSPERAKALSVAYVKVRCREYAVMHRRKIR